MECVRFAFLGREGVLESIDPCFEGEEGEQLVFLEVWSQMNDYLGFTVGQGKGGHNW